jgi:two-component system, chemotaxis family, chemotaxis protein CheY
MNVILAQESRMVRSLLRAALGPTKYAAARPREAGCTPELLQQLDAVGAEETLVLLDWNLPGLDVPLLLSHLAGLGMLDHVRILLSVNTGQSALAELAMRRGAKGYLVRPFTDEALAAKVEEIGRTSSGSGIARKEVPTVRVHEDLPSLFSLPAVVLSLLFARSTRATYKPGASILSPGDSLSSLSFVVGGEIEIQPESGERLVRGAGECFAERAFVSGAPSRIRVRATTAVEIASIAKENVVELARRHPALQDFLTLMLTRPSDDGTAEGEEEMSGSTASLPFSDLLQFLHASRKSGVLILKSEEAMGRIYLDQGEVRDARMAGEEPGESAFARLAALPGTRFEFRKGTAPAAPTIGRSTMQLLMGCFLASSEAVAV